MANNKVVCVTGATGYLASWLIKLLLERGYTVKGTVRSLRDPKKFEHLTSLEGAKDRLKLYEASLTEEGSYDSVIDGCEGVFHVASPIIQTADDPQKEIVDPIVKGTLDVLNACKKAGTVKRVVYTSTLATVVFVPSLEYFKGVTLDETWFSDVEFLEGKKEWYSMAKTIAEKAAWEFVKENDMDMVTIHPGYLIGPLLSKTLNSTSEYLLGLIKEARELFSHGMYTYVDVRDVALAHILSYEVPSASGRYNVVGTIAHSHQALTMMHDMFPSIKNHYADRENNLTEAPFHVSREKTEALGVKFTPLEESFRDSILSFKDMEFLDI